MKIKLINHIGGTLLVEVPDETKEIHIRLVSGDMVLTEPFYVDSYQERTTHYFNGSFLINRKDFERLNNLKNSKELCLF